VRLKLYSLNKIRVIKPLPLAGGGGVGSQRFAGLYHLKKPRAGYNLIKKSAAADFFLFEKRRLRTARDISAGADTIYCLLWQTIRYTARDAVRYVPRCGTCFDRRRRFLKFFSNPQTIFPEKLDFLTKKVYNIGWK